MEIHAAWPVGAYVAALEAVTWLDLGRSYIDAYQDAPKSLEDLQRAVWELKIKGYETHHVVEQAPAEKAGFSRDVIDAPENLVRIPTLKHWEITRWYATRNPQFGGLSPRNFLRDKAWDERQRMGLEALRLHRVLKP